MTLPFRAAKKWITKRIIPDYTDQLDLFSEAPVETPAPAANAPARTAGVSHARPRPQQLGFEVWEPLPPFDAGARAATKPVGGSTGGDGEPVHRPPPVQPDIDAPDVVSPGIANDDRRDPSARRVLDI